MYRNQSIFYVCSFFFNCSLLPPPCDHRWTHAKKITSVLDNVIRDMPRAAHVQPFGPRINLGCSTREAFKIIELRFCRFQHHCFCNDFENKLYCILGQIIFHLSLWLVISCVSFSWMLFPGPTAGYSERNSSGHIDHWNSLSGSCCFYRYLVLCISFTDRW